MVFSLGVNVLHICAVIDERGQGADTVLAGGKNIELRSAVLVKGKPVMQLHLSGNALMVAGVKVNARPLHNFRDTFAHLSFCDCWVCNAVNDTSFEVRVIVLNALDFTCNACRLPLHAHVGVTRAAV